MSEIQLNDYDKDDKKIMEKVKKILLIPKSEQNAKDKKVIDCVKYIFSFDFTKPNYILPNKKRDKKAYQYLKNFIEILWIVFQKEKTERDNLYKGNSSTFSIEITNLFSNLKTNIDKSSSIQLNKLNLKEEVFLLASEYYHDLTNTLYDFINFYFIIFDIVSQERNTFKYALYNLLKEKHQKLFENLDYEEFSPDLNNNNCLNLTKLYFLNIKEKYFEDLDICAFLIFKYKKIFPSFEKEIDYSVLQKTLSETVSNVKIKKINYENIGIYIYSNFKKDLEKNIIRSQEKNRKEENINNSINKNRHSNEKTEETKKVVNNNKKESEDRKDIHISKFYFGQNVIKDINSINECSINIIESNNNKINKNINVDNKYENLVSYNNAKNRNIFKNIEKNNVNDAVCDKDYIIIKKDNNTKEQREYNNLTKRSYYKEDITINNIKNNIIKKNAQDNNDKNLKNEIFPNLKGDRIIFSENIFNSGSSGSKSTKVENEDIINQEKNILNNINEEDIKETEEEITFNSKENKLMKSLDISNNDIIRKIMELEIIMNEKDQKIKELEKRMNEKDQKIMELEEGISGKDKKINNLKENMKKKNEEDFIYKRNIRRTLRNIEKNKKEKNKEINYLKIQVNKDKNSIVALKEEVQNLKSTLGSIQVRDLAKSFLNQFKCLLNDDDRNKIEADRREKWNIIFNRIKESLKTMKKVVNMN